MKVLIITASLDEKSGWGRYSTAVVKELARQGHQVEAFSENAADLPGVKVRSLKPLRFRLDIVSLLSNSLRIRSVARGTDIVHALDGWPYGVYGYAAVAGTSRKLFINGVGTYSVAPLFERGSAFLLRRAYVRAKEILCISDYTRDQVVAAGVQASKVRTVLMGAPELPSIPQEQIQAVLDTLKIRDAFPMILTVGSIKDRKGQLETLKAVKILKEKYPNIVYIVAGSGNQKEYITTLQKYADSEGLASHLRIVTGADDAEISALYAACTVFALNSNTDPSSHHFEGFGLVVIEAAGYGKPSVGSRDSGVESAIDDGKTGFLTDQHDPADIADKVGRILSQYEFFSSNAKMWHSKFTWHDTVRKYVQAYEG